MAKRLKLARPMVRRGTGLYANQAWWQLLEERQHVATLQLAADDHLAGGISRTVWPSAWSSRDQWCDDAHASMPSRHGGSFWKNARTERRFNWRRITTSPAASTP
jgi:hypothetical protein